ncbi:MAG: hypothetical protein GY861_23850 [bacterium]|nr:hypothetical protein [bacterium]
MMSKKRKKINNSFGQAILEFTFAMVLFSLFLYALLMAFKWVAQDLAERQIEHETTLLTEIGSGSGAFGDQYSPSEQLNPVFYKPRKLDMVYDGWK